MAVTLHDQRLSVARRLRIAFHRTLRIPDDGGHYPLPPGLGLFPITSPLQCAGSVPDEWRTPNTFLIPMYQREALWIGFENEWPPVAVTVAVGTVNAVSGKPAGKNLSADPQNYIVCPEQLWLDGINVGPATVRQFVAMPLGHGYTVEGAITGREEHGGIQISVFEPRSDVVLSRPTPPSGPRRAHGPASRKMGIGAGGRIAQRIYSDPHGVEVWDRTSETRMWIHLVNSLAYQQMTGDPPPATPIDAATYTAHGLPWFELYEEHKHDVAAPPDLSGAKTIAERDRELGVGDKDDPIAIDRRQVTPLKPKVEDS